MDGGRGSVTGISVRGATVLRGGRAVLEDASLSAPSGGVTSVLGMSGAGKTTLLAAIAGLARLDRGAVLQDGVDLAGQKRRAGVAFLPPGSALDGRATLGDALHGLAGRAGAEYAWQTAGRLGLGALLAREVGTLSHGEGLLALSAARLAKPGKCVLVDEAGTGLDEAAQAALLDVLRGLAAEGRTVVLATRSAAVALQADHVVLLEQGRVLQAGAAADVYREPASGACAQLTGAANILEGHVREVRAGAYIWSAGVRFVQAASSDVARPSLGTPIQLCLRPEHVRLLGAGERADNEIDALVIDVAFCGGMLRVRLSTQAMLLVAHLANGASGMRPEPGQRVRIGWAAAAAHVLPATAQVRVP